MGSFGNEKVHSSSSKKVKAPPRSEFVISMSVFCGYYYHDFSI